jgi:acyl dehydratase
MTAATIAAAQLPHRVGEEIGVSGWIEISQPLIDLFADATMDRQFIHVDPERAKATPFGGTIAHGFLLLSLLSQMAYTALPQIENTAMAVNYGLNRLRFLTPVKAGQHVRSRFVLNDVANKASDQILLTYGVTVEIEGGPKPALVAEWLTLIMVGPSAQDQRSEVLDVT